MAPMVHGLEAKYAGQVDFFYLDADDAATRDFQREYGFQYQPYFLLLDKDGNILKRWGGFVSQQEFEAAFVEVLK
jgi:thioredoxin-related protein